ncbi:MAG: OB-fold nucleic acid binding domain-containing protein [Candidatus Thorarchaeota archaeon]
MQGLEETIELILKHRSDYERSDIIELIEEKRQELGPDIINDESAAMLVARELGVELHRPASSRMRTKISDIKEPNKSVTIVARVERIGDVKTFTRKDGSGEGRLASLEVSDDTGRIRLVLWDDRVKMLEEDVLEEGQIVQIIKAYVRPGLGNTLELNLGKMGGIRPLEADEIEELGIDFESAPGVEFTRVADLQLDSRNPSVKVRVRWVSDVTEFQRKDGTTGRVMRIFGADESGSVGIVFWDDRVDDVKDVEKGEVIAVERGYTRANQRNNEIELHVGRFSVVRRRLDDDIRESKDAPAIKRETEPLGMTSIADLAKGMWDVDIEGQVSQIQEMRTFTRKDGSEGRVQNLVLVDKTGKVRAVFWDEDVDKISKVKIGDVIRISHGYVKEGFMQNLELVAGRKSTIEINPKDSKLIKMDLSDVTYQPTAVPERIAIEEIGEGSTGQTVEVSGIIVGIGQTSPVYQACPDCKKKLEPTEDGYACKHCKKDVEEPEPRMFFKITIDDGTETIRATMFADTAEQLLGMTAKEANEMIIKTGNIIEPIRRSSGKILGKYVRIVGSVNKFRDSIEVSARGFSFVDPIEEIERLNEFLQKEVA